MALPEVATLLVTALVALAVGAGIFWVLAGRVSQGATKKAEEDAKRILEDAERQANAQIKEAELMAKEKLLQARSEFEKISSERRQELETLERQLGKREDLLSRKTETFAQRETALSRQEKTSQDREAALAKKESRLETLVQDQRTQLEKIASLTAVQAKEELKKSLENEARMEAAHLVERIENEARENAGQEAQRIIGAAIQRSASDYVSETTVSVVVLPSDEMKGRIIGREGRNIRALEAATGVDLIVDDTPEAVILSGHDPFRREIARVVLERLITDGRIHPARIEEVVEKVKAEFDEHIFQTGRATLLEMNIPKMHPELLKLLGRLKYRTSYGQNILNHSKEVAFIAGALASELRCNTRVAKRAGLLHDIGKAVDRELEGSHLEIGIDLLRKYGEKEDVVHAMACHHGDYDPKTVEAVLVTAADALSAARPGARREVLESYIKRLEKLEEIAANFSGVKKSFAVQAGREIRIIVDSKKISDEKAIWLSRDIAKQVEKELTYPGHIKVTVIRETRSIEYAR